MAGEVLEAISIPFLALEAVQDPATDRDDLCVVWANPPARERLGAEVVGSWLDRDAPFGAMPSVVPETLRSREGAQEGVRHHMVERPVERDGRTEQLRFTFVPVEHGAAMMIEDITDEVAVRAELAVASRTLAGVERWGNLGVWEIDLLSGSAYWSTQVYEILGVEEEGLAQFFSIVHPDDLPLVEHVARRVVEQPGPYRLSHRIIRGAEVRTVDQHMQSVVDSSGRPARLLGTMIDVTETSALQQQVHQSQQMRTLGVLAGGLAHDFNNVLLVIRGHADIVLGRTEPDDPIRSSLEAISRAGSRASTLTRKLMSLGRQDELRPSRVAPEKFLSEVVELVRPALDPAIGVDVDVDPATRSIEVLADVEQLRQVMLDLVLNARDAGSRNIRLRFEERRVDHHDPLVGGSDIPPGGYGVLQVIDDGSGMDETTRRRMFDPFFTTKDASSGSGLGLANAQGFAQRSLGALLVDTDPGTGTTMSLLLPARVRAAPAERPPRRRRNATRVVVAAGDQDRCDRLSRVLENLGHQVVCVTDLDALSFSVETEPIDLVVVDDRLLGTAAPPRVLDRIAAIVVTDRSGAEEYSTRTVTIDDHLGLEDTVTEVLSRG